MLLTEGALNLGEPAFWTRHLEQILSSISAEKSPMDIRGQLDCCVQELLDKPGTPPTLVLLFGSLARGDAPSDIDIIVISDSAQKTRVYNRFRLGTWTLDLNIADSTWLQDAWRNIEWGYWLNDSHVLGTNLQDLDLLWRKSANRYWSAEGRAMRATEHKSLFLGLAEVAGRIDGEKHPLCFRFLAHETARALACGLIDRFGDRNFSHRTLLTELSELEGFPLSLEAIGQIQRHLCFEISKDESYLETRKHLSALYRDTWFQSLTGYSPDRPIRDRYCALVDCLLNEADCDLENLLAEKGAQEWLPSASELEILLNIGAAYLHSEITRPKQVRTVITPPRKGHILGARWAEMNGNRLKLIFNTGGCKTASCTFCSLPAYGRSSSPTSPAATVGAALALYRPESLALYNDGNFLNPRELAISERQEVCRTVGKFNVQKLTIETIPRYVTKEDVLEIIDLSGTRLTVAMGFQLYGNAFAVGHLGRPDVDALFDRAIDEIHEVGAEVRLYLLAGLESYDSDLEMKRLLRSIHWAQKRQVELISVCPYRSEGRSLPTTDLTILQRTIRSIHSVDGVRVEMLGQSLDSCKSAG